ncbi:MAG: DUF4350 domain-containing protein, partial [Deltaproteobacteria bacterium]|nr:DUF4350 domain-containing protein [Deltaproteobacteria bacterium]
MNGQKLMNVWMRRVLVPVSGLLLILSERIMSASPARPWLAGLGVLGILLALGWTLALGRRADPHLRRAWGWLALPPLALLLSLALYGAALLLRDSAGWLDWPALAGWAWVLMAVMALALFVPLELAAATGSAHLDPRRMQLAGRVGIRLGLALSLLIVVNFIFNRGDWQWDLAYFKSTAPSAVTLEAVRGLEEPIEAGVFFGVGSPPESLVQSYFHELERAAPTKFKVTLADRNLDPALAERFQVVKNGMVMLMRGESTKGIKVGETLEEARQTLRKLDETVLGKLREMTRPRRNIYFTAGHGERSEPASDKQAPGESVGQFRSLISKLNYQIKPLGLNDGLGDAVPADATLVVVAAPERPFLEQEAAALRRYLDAGGKLMAFLEPNRPGVKAQTGPVKGVSLTQLIAEYGLEYEPVVQANDRIYARRTFTQADHGLLVTAAFGSYPVLASLRNPNRQSFMLTLGSGALHTGKVPEALSVNPVLMGMPGTWGDDNGNFQWDQARGEKRIQPLLVAAITRKPATQDAPEKPGEDPRQNLRQSPMSKNRKAPLKPMNMPKPKEVPKPAPTLLVFADMDVASDLLMQHPVNREAMELSLNWLGGIEAGFSL